MLKPVIFISAVSRELKTSRQIVANTLQAIGFEPVWQDVFDLSADEIPAMLRKKIDRSSAVLQIVGDAFGGECSEVPPGSPFARCSYTQYEALYAKSVGKPVYYLIASSELPRDLTPEQLGEEEEKRRLQAKYKEAVLAGQTVYYEVSSHDSTENKVRKLKDELEKLRRGFLRTLAIGGIGLAAILLLVVLGIVLQQRDAAAAADAERVRALAQRERDVAHQEALAEQRRLAEEEAKKREAAEAAAKAERETMLAAIRGLSDQVARTNEPGQELDQATRLARAYALLEDELKLEPGTLLRELPGFAEKLLADAETPPSDRQAALYAAGRYDEAEALALEIARQDLAEAQQKLESAIEQYVAAGHAARADLRFADAMTHYEKAADLVDKERDPARWAETTFWSANSLHDLGRFALAAERFESIDRVLTEASGDDDPLTLETRYYIARAYYRAGRLKDAETLFERTAERQAAILGEDAKQTLITQGALAGLYCDLGFPAKAAALLEATLAIQSRTFGANHPTTLVVRHNLAVAYTGAGETDKALPIFEEGLDRALATYGERHRETIACMSVLASAYQDADRLDEAIALHERVLAADETTLGRRHPDTLTAINNLGVAYIEAGRTEEGLPLLEEALTSRKEELGEEHPLTLASAQSLAAAYFRVGRSEEGFALLDETLQYQIAALGEDHPDTISTLNVQAVAIQEDGRIAEALPLFRKALALRTARLGADHPETMGSRFNLATCLTEMEQYEEAIDLFEETLAQAVPAMGDDSLLVARIRGNYGYCLLATGEQERGLEQSRLAWEGTRASLPAGHPQWKAQAEAYFEALKAAELLDEAEDFRARVLADYEDSASGASATTTD